MEVADDWEGRRAGWWPERGSWFCVEFEEGLQNDD